MKRSFVSILLLLTLLLLTACGNGRIMQGVIVLEDDSILQPPASTNQLPSAPADGSISPPGMISRPLTAFPRQGRTLRERPSLPICPLISAFPAARGLGARI